MKSKKALGTLQSVIITLLIIGLVLGIGFLVLSEFEETLGDTVGTVVNESITPTDNGIYVVNNYSTANLYCYNSFSVTNVYNGSTPNTINSGNWSYEPATGKFWNLTGTYSAIGWNISYTYQYDNSEACQGLNETVSAMEEIPTWLAIIVILLIVAILLAIVFKVIPTAGEGGGSIGGGFSGGGSSPVTAEI